MKHPRRSIPRFVYAAGPYPMVIRPAFVRGAA
jgi:hypothetical protein